MREWLVAAAMVALVTDFLAGRYGWPSLRMSRRHLAARLDRAWAAGWDERDVSARELTGEMQATIERLQEDRDALRSAGYTHAAGSHSLASGEFDALDMAEREAPQTAGDDLAGQGASDLRWGSSPAWLSEPMGEAQERAASHLDLPGPASAPPDDVSRELAHSRRAGELLDWTVIRAHMDPLDVLKIEGWDIDRRQEARLAAWQVSCRASWELTKAAA